MKPGAVYRTDKNSKEEDMKLKTHTLIIAATVLVMSAISCASLISPTNQSTSVEGMVIMGKLKKVLPIDQQITLDTQKYHPTADGNSNTDIMVKQTWSSINGDEYKPLTIGKKFLYPIK